MQRKWLVIVGVLWGFLPLSAGDWVDQEIARIYLDQAIRSNDVDASRLLMSKALQFDSQNSDVLYYIGLYTPVDQMEERTSLFQRAVAADNWHLIYRSQGLIRYWESLALTHQFPLLLELASANRALTESNPSLLHCYLRALEAQDSANTLEDAINTAWLLYSSETKFWGFFLERERFFSAFFDYLKGIEQFPKEILQDFLAHLPASQAERQALLLLLKDKNGEDLTLNLYLSLDGLIAQDEALYLLKACPDVRDLNLLWRFWESLRDPNLKIELEDWFKTVTGVFTWTESKTGQAGNWLNVNAGALVDWSYVNGRGGRNEITFYETQPATYSQSGIVRVTYGIYPMVESISLKHEGTETIYSLGNGLLSLPLVTSTFLSSLSVPLFLPLETQLITYDLKESLWLPYVVRVEVFEGDNLRLQTDYLHGRPIRRGYVNAARGTFDRWDFWENGQLTSVQRDLAGDGYFDVLAVSTPDGQGFYTLFDLDHNGLTDFLYYQDAHGIVEYWDWFDTGKIDTLFMKGTLGTSRLIPLLAPEAQPWLSVPQFQLKD